MVSAATQGSCIQIRPYRGYLGSTVDRGPGYVVSVCVAAALYFRGEYDMCAVLFGDQNRTTDRGKAVDLKFSPYRGKRKVDDENDKKETNKVRKKSAAPSTSSGSGCFSASIKIKMADCGDYDYHPLSNDKIKRTFGRDFWVEGGVSTTGAWHHEGQHFAGQLRLGVGAGRPWKPPIEGGVQHLVQVGGGDEVQVGPDVGRKLLQVLLVALGKDDALHSRPVGRQHLVLDPAHLRNTDQSSRLKPGALFSWESKHSTC
ncbi:hypothetical protein EYF80_018628 [Liparis tanakae]|uniref:Uncharacterized protein n=1 Tax=Liparis tanakae TaxID=230148 RepID=A0A4Z2HZK9_9TELE|nr:hypothetical protein EYF80_018628 [Liparis tanakae]